MLRLFAKMESYRGDKGVETYKRLFQIPVCVGLPGIGKTRFARIFFTYLLQKLSGFQSPTIEQMLEKCAELAEQIWPNEGEHLKHVGLLRHLVYASHEDRNIRIALNCTPSSDMIEVESEIIKCVLVEWIKH